LQPLPFASVLYLAAPLRCPIGSRGKPLQAVEPAVALGSLRSRALPARWPGQDPGRSLAKTSHAGHARRPKVDRRRTLRSESVSPFALNQPRSQAFLSSLHNGSFAVRIQSVAPTWDPSHGESAVFSCQRSSDRSNISRRSISSHGLLENKQVVVTVFVLILFSGFCVGAGASQPAGQSVPFVDVNGRMHTPLSQPGKKATVL